MAVMRFKEYENDVKKYCANNSLDFNKLKSMPKTMNESHIYILYHEPNNSINTNGIIVDRPMPIVLELSVKENKLIINETNHTREYLS